MSNDKLERVAPCPFCGERPRQYKGTQVVVHSVSDCPIDGRNYNLEQWNTRAACEAEAGEPTEAMIEASYAAAKAGGLTGTREDVRKFIELVLRAALNATAGEG